MGKKAKVKVKVKKRKLKIKRILFCLIFLCLLAATFYLAKKIPIKNIYIIGNNIVSDKEIISTAKIDNYPSFIDTSKKDIIKRLEKNDYIKEVRVEKKLLSKIYIYVTENKPISLLDKGELNSTKTYEFFAIVGTIESSFILSAIAELGISGGQSMKPPILSTAINLL